jgi:hypothetical protein
MANWPDTIIKNKKEKTRIMTDVAISADRNVHKRQQKTNCNTTVYVQRYNKYMIKPVITEATGTVTKCLQKHLEAVTGNYCNIFSTKYSCIRNITINTESIAV